MPSVRARNLVALAALLALCAPGGAPADEVSSFASEADVAIHGSFNNGEDITLPRERHPDKPARRAGSSSSARSVSGPTHGSTGFIHSPVDGRAGGRVAADGHGAEIAFVALPGKVVHGAVAHVVDGMARRHLQPSGNLVSPAGTPELSRRMVVVDIEGDLSIYSLDSGREVRLAFYIEPWNTFAIIRRAFLRKNGWKSYLFID